MAIITKSLSTSLGIADIAVQPGVNRVPLTVIDGNITNLPANDHLLEIPESQIFIYDPDLAEIRADSGYKKFVYSGDRLETITDEASNTVSTFNYDNDGTLVSIVVNSYDYEVLFTTTGSVLVDPTVTRLSNTPPTWKWGDGNESVGDSVSHTYAAEGSYDVEWNLPDSGLSHLTVNQDKLTKLNTKESWTNLYYLHCSNNLLTELNTFASWTDLDYLSCVNNYFSHLETFASWSRIRYFYCYGSTNTYTKIDTFSTWVKIRYLYLGNTLTSLDTFDTWVDLYSFYCNNNQLTSLDTFDTWTALRTFHCGSNQISSLDTYNTWTNILQFGCANNNLASLDVFSSWVICNLVYCNINSLPASEIDDILTNLDAAGVSNGILKYETNPGSADIDRSPAAATSKANLVARGWVITN